MNTGEQLKEEGMDVVYANSPEEWKMHVAEVIGKIPKGMFVTGEDIRRQCKLEPHHHNAWGAVISAHVRNESLIPTGDWKKSITPKAHARMIQIYRKA